MKVGRLAQRLISIGLLMALGTSACQAATSLSPTPPVATVAPATSTERSSATVVATSTPDERIRALPLDADPLADLSEAYGYTSTSPNGVWTSIVIGRQFSVWSVARGSGWLVLDPAIDRPGYSGLRVPTRVSWTGDGRYMVFWNETSERRSEDCRSRGPMGVPIRLDLNSGELAPLIGPSPAAYPYVSVAPSGAFLAAIDQASTRGTITLIDLTNGGITHTTFSTTARAEWDISLIRWSPSGRYFGFALIQEPCAFATSGVGVHLVDAAGGQTWRVGETYSRLNADLNWRGDDVVLLYADQDGIRAVDRASGTELPEPVAVPEVASASEVAAWSLSFVQGQRDGAFAYIVSAQGGTPRRVSPNLLAAMTPGFDQTFFDWSPSGDALAGTLQLSDGATSPLVAIDVASGSVTELARLGDGTYLREPRWSPDGSALVVEGSGVASATADIYRIDLPIADANVGAVTPLTHTPDEGEISPVWSPDGSQIAFLTAAGSGLVRIEVVKADGSDRRIVLEDPTYPHDLAWSPDGQFLAYSNMSALGAIYVLDLKSGMQRPITGRDYLSQSDIDASPTWSPDGQFIAYIARLNDVTSLNVARSDGTGWWRVVVCADSCFPAVRWSPT